MSGQGRRGMRPAVTAALVASAFCLVAPHPAYADPTPPPGTTVPDPGTAPYTTDQTPAQVPTVAGPLAAQIITESSAVELLGEQVTAMNADVAAANQALAGAYATWQAAHQAMVQAQQDAADAASRAYQDADSMGPLDGLSDALSGLGALAPGLNTVVPVTPPDPKVLAAAAAEAQQREQDTFAAYRSAQATAQALANQQSTLKAGYDQRRAALTDLISRNQAAADAAQAVQDARDAALAGRYAAGSNVHGEVANPKALAALAWAVRQIGKPYEWGAEGPNSFDCSGLVWASYRSVGVTLPRVARDQQHALTPISPSELLPGDLIFFNPTSETDWTTVSHVGIYYGNGLMVEAPTFGQSVKIATVWWSAYFSAARVFPAVPAPSPSPTTSPSPSPSPSGTPSTPPSEPSGEPSSGTPSSAPPSSTPPSSPSPSASPSPSPAPESSPSPEPSASPSSAPAG